MMRGFILLFVFRNKKAATMFLFRYIARVDDNKTALYQQTNFQNSSQFMSGLSVMRDEFCSEGQLCDLNGTMLDSVYYACAHAVMMFNDYNPCKYIPPETMHTYEYSG